MRTDDVKREAEPALPFRGAVHAKEDGPRFP
jgi:hypothetical protein